jgi:hypothetical protein
MRIPLSFAIWPVFSKRGATWILALIGFARVSISVAVPAQPSSPRTCHRTACHIPLYAIFERSFSASC